jgi:uncharacterized coiled-coil DUF342 family protein
MTLSADDPQDMANPRTQAMLKRLRQAMADIEAEIASHHGVYPYNHGRVTQSELCRRADVKKATLQTPLHKESTRIEVMAWLDGLSVKLAGNRDATRQRVTAVADELNAEVERLKRELETAHARIDELTAELQRLRSAPQPRA